MSTHEDDYDGLATIATSHAKQALKRAATLWEMTGRTLSAYAPEAPANASKWGGATRALLAISPGLGEELLDKANEVPSLAIERQRILDERALVRVATEMAARNGAGHPASVVMARARATFGEGTKCGPPTAVPS